MALINLRDPTSSQVIRFHGTGPETTTFAVEMLLHYDPFSARWVIAQLQNFEYVAMHTLTSVPNGEIQLSPLCLLDYDDAAETPGISHLLALTGQGNMYSFFCPKPFDVHLTSDRIVKTDVTLQPALWDELKDEAASLLMENVLPRFSLPPQEIFLPDNAFFDPSIDTAHQTLGVHIVDQTVLAEAELSMVYMDQHIHMLVLYAPEHRAKAQETLPSGSPHEGKQWRIWFTGWDSSWSKQRWTYAPDLGVPFPIDPDKYEYAGPSTYVAVIAGPLIASSTLASVVAAFAIDMQQEVVSHAVCLDEHGDVVQVCGAPLGLRPCLCCCDHMVVGVDLFEGNWRLWNWDVLQQQQFTRSISLAANCQRAFVYAEPASERFWLVEELPDGVRVTHRDALTLEEIVPEVYFPGMRLGNDAETPPLNSYLNIGLNPYEHSLLLLLMNIQSEELALYQVQ